MLKVKEQNESIRILPFTFGYHFVIIIQNSFDNTKYKKIIQNIRCVKFNANKYDIGKQTNIVVNK